jgi:hypothetical protein
MKRRGRMKLPARKYVTPIFYALLVLFVFVNYLSSEAYEIKDKDDTKKIVFLRGYEIKDKKEGYLIYSEAPAGALHKAACISAQCDKWTKDPQLFEKYKNKKIKIKTGERLQNNQREECVMDILYVVVVEKRMKQL